MLLNNITDLHNKLTLELVPKCHLKQFSHFHRPHEHDQLTHRQTEHATPSVATARPHIMQMMQCK